MNRRKMDSAYAQLSLRAGCLAAFIDTALGTKRFEVALRNQAWELTEETLETIKCHAIQLGCPPSVLDAAESRATEFVNDSENIGRALKLQRQVDLAMDRRREMNARKGQPPQ